MGSYGTYASYKPSGLEWLGEIPATWITTRVKFLGDLILGLTYSPDDVVRSEGALVLRSSNIQNGKLDLADRVYVNCVIPKKIVTKKNDILICSRNGSRALIGKCALLTEEVEGQAFGAFMTVLRSEYASFLYYVLNSSLFNFQSGRFLTSTINQLTTQTLGDFEIALPPIEEQQTIVRFLDFKTAQIDALIVKKKALLDKLAEKRTALISLAVTKGLDPNVPMKDSGVEWLGEIPAHWDVWKVTHGFERIGSGTTPKSDNSIYYDGSIPWVTTSELRESIIFDTAQKVTEEAVSSYSALKVYPVGSLAIAMYGATIGRLGMLGIEATFNQACCVFSEPVVFDNKFIYYWLWMRRPVLISLSNGGGQPNLSQDDLKKIRIPIPDLAEQKKIVEFLDKGTARIDEQSRKVNEVISKLQEYRSALVTNAVTGKIDVRGFELPEPAKGVTV